MPKIAPILKWAGGKRQLLSKLLPQFPSDIDMYYEPFVGAGAVLLALMPQKAIIGDVNSELMNVYKVIKENADELIILLEKHEREHCSEHYYEVRDIDRNLATFERLSNIEKASRTIYLNRTCFNGLYRVNRHGYFNTPIGKNTSIQIVNRAGILAISEYLNSASVQMNTQDYRITLQDATRNDFVFLDPPYYQTSRDSFIRYDTSTFNVNEQMLLRDVCDDLNEKGIRFIQTNSDCQEIRELYSQYRLIEVDVRRSINAKAEGRQGKELIICNY